MNIESIIKSVQNIMRQDEGVDGDAQRISQLVWMLFLKVFDDKEEEWSYENGYINTIPVGLRWRDWAADDEGITGDALLDFINNKLFKELKELPIDENHKRLIVKAVFEDSYNYMKSGVLIRQVVNKLNEIDFNRRQDRHLFNDIYEKILKDLQNAGNAGEFYTPRPVTQFIVDMIDPKLGEKILDPACGTGGFLICALEHLKNQAKTGKDIMLLQESLFGTEKKPLPHLLAITNLVLHDIDKPHIRRGNSLTRNVRDYRPSEKVDIIITNPPFGGIEEDGVQSNVPAMFSTKETADLFLVLIMHILKDRGRCGIVLPDGFLFGEGVKTRIKEKLLTEFDLHTIVRLPKGVFSPYTDINTNLLFFSKGRPTTEVWFYELPLPDTFKKYTKTKPINIEEFNALKSWWNDRMENDFAWKVSLDEIQDRNYNLDIKNPSDIESVVGQSTDQLVAMLETSLDKARAALNNIKKEL
ncbi:MAG: class I SAM-dependent DNA methyltransferase [Ruminiclostridium sp.]|nr:class I SAM-dependent DNA methyltransferase [Ruminiclostridium sp.]